MEHASYQLTIYKTLARVGVLWGQDVTETAAADPATVARVIETQTESMKVACLHCC